MTTIATIEDDAPSAAPEIPEVLRCPISRQPLRPLDDAELARLNEETLRHRDGSPVAQALDAGLVSEDGRFAYSIRDGVIVLLAELAIPLDADASAAHVLADEKQIVRDFYDATGWQKDDGELFVDTVRFEDLRPVSHEYVSATRRRVDRHLRRPGKYLLDAASGPVQYPEYEAYSDGFERRICVDLSFVALQAAKERLGDRGVYVLADITNLPLADDSVDGVVSLHTIYHVPREEQRRAFEEIHRVLAPGANAVVVYFWRNRSLLNLPARAFHKAKRLARRARSGGVAARAELYFHAHDLQWLAGQRWPFHFEVLVWRSVSVDFLRRYAHERLLGRTLLAALYRLEERFPHLTARYGRYPMIVIGKHPLRRAATAQAP